MTNVLLQQGALLSASLVLATVSLRAARRQRLAFGAAVLWSAIAVVGVIGALAIPVVDRLGSILGLGPAAVLSASASSVLATIAFLLTLRVAALEASLQDTVERLGLATAETIRPPARPDDPLVVVPAFNEESTVGDVVRELRDAGLHVIVVDDGSTDSTARRSRDAGAVVVRLPTNLGVGGALRAGFRAALDNGYSQVVQCDADGQHPIEEVLRIIEAQRHDPHDVLIGSRFTQAGSRIEHGLVRRTAMSILALLASRATRSTITDATSGLRVIRQPLLGELARHLPRHYLGDTFEVLIAAGRAGFSVAEHPVRMRERAYGPSTATFGAALGLTLRAVLIAVMRGHARLDSSLARVARNQ